MKQESIIYVAGHRGMVGAALLRNLKGKGYTNLLTKNHKDLDLTNQTEVEQFFTSERPQYVFLAAAKVGGIWANQTYPADFIYHNLAIQTNVLQAASRVGVERLLFLGSSCIYPKYCPQPIKEEYLLAGPLEPTNEAYAVAKIAGIKMCEAYNRQYATNYLCVMPTNLYGPGDNFDLQTSHVLPALIRKFHEGRNFNQPVVLWGTGKAKREFLHVDDCAEACIFLMNLGEEAFQNLLEFDAGPLINVGTGEDLTIRELAHRIKEEVGFEGEIQWDDSKPDGTPQKLLDISRLKALGWKPTISLQEGIRCIYQEFCEVSHQVLGG